MTTVTFDRAASHMRVIHHGLLAMLLSATLTGCASSEPAPASGSVKVIMREYSFTHTRSIPAGRLLFTATNAGRLDHEMFLGRLPDGFPASLDAQLHGTVRRPIESIAYLSVPAHGEVNAFAVRLTAGRYALLCFVRDADDVPHALKGMSADLYVH